MAIERRHLVKIPADPLDAGIRTVLHPNGQVCMYAYDPGKGAVLHAIE